MRESSGRSSFIIKKFLSKRNENEVYEMRVEKVKIDGVRGSYFHTEHVEVIVDYVVNEKR